MNIKKNKVLPNYHSTQEIASMVALICTGLIAGSTVILHFLCHYKMEVDYYGQTILLFLNEDGTWVESMRATNSIDILYRFVIIAILGTTIGWLTLFIAASYIAIFCDRQMKQPLLFGENDRSKHCYPAEYLIVDQFALPFVQRNEKGQYDLYYCLTREETYEATIGWFKRETWQSRQKNAYGWKVSSGVQTPYFEVKELHLSRKHLRELMWTLKDMEGLNYVLLRVPLKAEEVRCRAMFSEREIGHLYNPILQKGAKSVEVAVNFNKTITLTEEKLLEMAEYVTGREDFYLYLPQKSKLTSAKAACGYSNVVTAQAAQV